MREFLIESRLKELSVWVFGQERAQDFGDAAIWRGVGAQAAAKEAPTQATGQVGDLFQKEGFSDAGNAEKEHDAALALAELFEAFEGDPGLLPPEAQQHAERAAAEKGEAGRARVIADYIAGMTDRYAIAEHQRLFDPMHTT